MASIRRHCLERDKGIVCAARNCRASHRRQGLAPRCRLVASWGWSRSQGLGCSPIKAVRELGLERKLHCVLLQKCSTRNPTYIGGTRPDNRTVRGQRRGKTDSSDEGRAVAKLRE